MVPCCDVFALRLVIIIIVSGAEPTGLCVHHDLAIFPALGSDRVKIPAIAHDAHILPSVGLQFLTDLIFGHWLITRD